MSTARHVRRSPFRIVTIDRYDPDGEQSHEENYKIRQISMIDVISHPILEVSNLETNNALLRKFDVQDDGDIPEGMYDDIEKVGREIEGELTPAKKAERQALTMEAALRLGLVRPRIATEEELEQALMMAADAEQLEWTQLDDDDKADLDPMPYLSDKVVTVDYIKSDIVRLFIEIQKLSGLDAQSEQLASRFRVLRDRSASKKDSANVSG
jgi:hypothetical protein